MRRLARILFVALRFRLVPPAAAFRAARGWPGAAADPGRAVRLRHALEALGPIFVKFGQVLSTRRDLLAADIADELAKLQDQVPPFPAELAVAEIERGFGRPLGEVFAEFDREPVASASVAQVHFARLPDGREVAVKVLRPGIEAGDRQGRGAARDARRGLIERLWADGRRLKPREVVAEFAQATSTTSSTCMREAANASQLRRNFAGSPLLARAARCTGTGARSA